MSELGVVVIGRNEGERLARCLDSVARIGASVVYVDSGSTDGSVEEARSRGGAVVDLDMSAPFTAARARNAGFARLLEEAPGIDFVQFVDGDCELDERWPGAASSFLRADVSTAIVCGRLYERERERSIYNRLADMEWNVPPGAVRACGGIFMIRREAFEQAQGFNESLIAGEEPDLCFRLLDAGWTVHRLPDRMATHDAAMTQFGQWWRRSVRTGFAYAEVARLRRRSPGRPWRREVVRNWMWGLGFPLIAFGAAPFTSGLSLLVFLLYPIGSTRIARHRVRVNGDTPSDALLYAVFCMLAKFPAALGQAAAIVRRANGREPGLIEYKDAPPPADPAASGLCGSEARL